MKKRKEEAILSSVCGLAVMMASGVASEGKSISAEDALARLHGELGGNKAKAVVGMFEIKDVASVVSVDDIPCAYIFSNAKNGYAVVNADTRGAVLLGYGDAAIDNGKELPPPMRWWIGQYAAAIRSLPENGVVEPEMVTAMAERSPIPPLCASRWGQGNPYNLYCPEIEGEKTWTGCVATSMAQLMYHFKWPERGNGNHSYVWNDKELTADFSAMRFSWEEMLDSYKDEEAYTRQQAEAVALLHYACGVAVDMNYGLSGSGAEGEDQVKALTRHFGYGRSTTLLERKYFGSEDWEALIYGSLDAGAPVAYMGFAQSGGHAFLLDGYGEDGFFHFNWGWTGDADGYFLLSSINPYEESLSGYAYGYNADQKAVVYALPCKERDTPLVVMSNRSVLSGRFDTASSMLTLEGNFSYCGNDKTTVRTGIKLTDSNGEESCFYEGPAVTMEKDEAISAISVDMPSLQPGVYSLTPMYHDGVEWQRVSTYMGNPSSVMMTVEEEDVKFCDSEKLELVLVEMKYNTPFYMGRPFEVEFEIRNDNEYEEGLIYYIAFLNANGRPIWNYNPEMLLLQGGETRKIVSQNELPFFSSLGEYSIGIAYKKDGDVKFIGDPKPFTLESAPPGFSFESTGMTISQSAESPDEYKLNYGIHSIEGFYGYVPRIAVKDSEGNLIRRKKLGTVRDFVLDGETSHFARIIRLFGLEAGEYHADLYASVSSFSEDADDDIYMPCIGTSTFRVENSYVENTDQDDCEIYVDADGNLHAPEGSKIFNVQGMEINGHLPDAGILIVRRGCTVKKIMIN